MFIELLRGIKMRTILLRSIIIGAAAIAPILGFAGGVEVEPCCNPPRVDIPDMPAGWGFVVEGAALRGYNNDLDYFALTGTDVIRPIPTVIETYDNSFIKQINPVYAFGLRVGVDYTLADSANVIKLSYEHLFNRLASNDGNVVFETLKIPVLLEFEGEARQKLDGATLLSEQHILIGSYWEATISGGVRFAHLGQELEPAGLLELGFSELLLGAEALNANYTMQFNGVGPLVGVGGLFHLNEMFGIGANVQGALLMGRNSIDAHFTEFLIEKTGITPPTLTVPPLTIATGVASAEIENIYSIVPEFFYRIYANYNYHFDNGSQLELEGGWRANQFFNVRTFQTGALSTTPGAALNVGTTLSDDIGFSGPYFLVHYKL